MLLLLLLLLVSSDNDMLMMWLEQRKVSDADELRTPEIGDETEGDAPDEPLAEETGDYAALNR